MNKLLHISGILLFCINAVSETVRIRERETIFDYHLRVRSFTEKAESISTPVNWLPVKSISSDGAEVKKGSIITEFDTSNLEYRLQEQQLRKDVVDAELEEKLHSIVNKDQDMKDRKQTVSDELEILHARLKRYLSLPDKDEIKIAEGRYRVALLNAEAAEKDLEKGKVRFERRMISRAALNKLERTHLEQKANLTYAEKELNYTKLPASSSTITQLELQIENSKLEIAKLNNEIEEYKSIAEMRKSGAASRKEVIEKRISETLEDIQKARVKAPIDGYTTYSERRNNPVEVGAKMWKNFVYMKIPDMSTIAFKGVIPEQIRKYFRQGDKAEVRILGQAGQPIVGTIKSISKLPHDLAEKDENSWGETGREYGVKVFDVVISCTEKPEWLRPGMYGEAIIQSSQTFNNPAVPLEYIKRKNDTFHLSFNGVYRPVKGMPCKGWFLLDDKSLEGETVDNDGTFPEDGSTDSSGKTTRFAKKFSVTGELTPANSADVIVQELEGPWPKITWLIAEESSVKKGERVAELDTTDLDERISQQESRLKEAESSRDERKKQLDLTARESEFKIKTAENELEIARLKVESLENSIDYPAFIKAELDFKLANIRLNEIKQKFERAEKKDFRTLSPAELKKLERQREKNEIRLELARMRLNEIEEGPSELQLSQARLNLLKKETNFKKLQKSANLELLNKQRSYQRSVVWARRRKKRMERNMEIRKNFFLSSPEDGIIRYNKIWNSGKISKVNVGSVVGERFKILSIPDVSSMFINIEVPEKYFSRIAPNMEVDVLIPSLSGKLLSGNVTNIDFLFKNKQKKDSQVGLYSSHEALGEVVFATKITISSETTALKPGAIAEVYFPFAAK